MSDFAGNPRAALARRNLPLAPFWLTPALARPRDQGRLLIADAENTFTAMGLPGCALLDSTSLFAASTSPTRLRWRVT